MTKRKLSLLLITATTLSLAGCSPDAIGAGAGDGWETPEVAEDPSAVTSATTLPSDSYRLSFEQYQAMGEVQVRMLEACAAEFGVEMEFFGEYVHKPNYPYVWGGLFGTMSEEQAEEFGYLAAPGGPWKRTGGFTLRRPDDFGPYTSELGANDEARAGLYRVVASGAQAQDMVPKSQQVEVPRDADGDRVPSGGCLQRVEDDIGVPLDRTLDEDLFDLLVLSLEQPRVARAQDEWKACMKSATGETFETVDSGWVQGGRKEIAVADVQCTKETRWPDYFYPVYIDYQKQMIAKEPERFDAALAAERKRFDVLTGGSASG
ncbi:hypothetical protein [Leucobacter sp. wl10]|uniref:hypothetical protein n=1 Tax=Leucobacter sp. wl10 TaxID=2304677 RepID=UPI000E5B566D|nr:hypothetical protein [Leucobacter sp. wl10]RGE21497.1 hypothetical protein D1J51_06580 [Leucobacter sp. wl10]